MGWSHSERLLVSGSTDRTARVWSTAASVSAATSTTAGVRGHSPAMVIDTIGGNFKHQTQNTTPTTKVRKPHPLNKVHHPLHALKREYHSSENTTN